MEKPTAPITWKAVDFYAAEQHHVEWQSYHAQEMSKKDDGHRQDTKELLERISRKLVIHQNDKRISAIMNEFIDAEIAKLEEKG